MEEKFGQAAGELKLCGLRLYLYFIEDKERENISFKQYAAWLGKNYDLNGRSVRKAVSDGVADLIKNGYLEEIEDGRYKFYERKKL